jgi:DNA-binding transcriptional regulator YiaG
LLPLELLQAYLYKILLLYFKRIAGKLQGLFTRKEVILMQDVDKKPKPPMKVQIAKALTGIFLLLTISHVKDVLLKFEKGNELMTWATAGGVEAATAFAAYISVDKTAKKEARILAGVWLAALIGLSYALNLEYYLQHGAGLWAYFLAGIFPVSVAMIGAINGGLVVDIVPTTITTIKPEPVKNIIPHKTAPAWPKPVAPAPQQQPRLNESPADSGGMKEDFQPINLHDLLEETAPVLVGAMATNQQQTNNEYAIKHDKTQELPDNTQENATITNYAKVKALRDEGATWQEVSNALGKSVRTVQNWYATGQGV